MTAYPNTIIRKMDKETKILFEKLFGKKENSEIDIVDELNKVVKPVGGFLQQKKSYKEILGSIAKRENINDSNLNINQIEERIMVKRFNANFESLSEEKKQAFQAEINKELEKQGLDSSQIKSLSAIGALTAANASGFSMYIMASTIVGGVTGILGITLPFAFYTGMSSVLSVITGPIGWTIGLGYLVYKFKDESIESATEKFTKAWKSAKNFLSGDIERASIIVSIICSIRILNNEKIHQELKRAKEEISNFEIEKESLMNEVAMKTRLIEEKESKIQQLEHELHNEQEAKQRIDNSLRTISMNITKLRTEIFQKEQEII